MTHGLRIALLFCAFASLPVAHGAEYRWYDVDRVVAISDPHGAYDAMRTTLAHAGIIDADGNWDGGASHLVITGDLLDRGADSRPIMDLVMQLEQQAAGAGGMVHLTLGNHEVMNLVGDLRYVARDEFGAFAEEETAEERERWFQAALSAERERVEGDVDEAALREAFDGARPPGFYAHRRAFSSTGQYGRWLLEKPLMVVVNDTAFVHGGMPAMVAFLGLEQLNEQLGEQVKRYVEALDYLYEHGHLDPAVNFYDQADMAEAMLAADQGSDELTAALQAIVDLNDAQVHDSTGPLWYRGTVGCSALTEGDVFDSALAGVGASRVVIGHTPTLKRQVLTRFDGRVIEIDTGMLNAAYQGSGFALILEGDDVSVAQEQADALTTPVPHPRQVGQRNAALDADTLASLMADGEIISTTTDDSGRTIVEFRYVGAAVTALFAPDPGREGFQPELAAYRLDRLLGLDLVPVTVAREIDGVSGTLQFLPNNARDEGWRAGAGQGGGAWCPLGRQWNSMYVFDALIRNEGRVGNSMMYSPGNWQLLSVGHSEAFATGRGRPKYLKDSAFSLTSAWVDALSGLSDDALRETLGDVLSRRQIRAIGQRRDVLLRDLNLDDPPR